MTSENQPVIAALVNVLDAPGLEALPTEVISTARARLADALIQDGDLGRAAAILGGPLPDNADARRHFAALWLRLADSQAHRTDEADHSAAEASLRRGIELDPTQGLPALARYLQRGQRWVEAAQIWREATRTLPMDPNVHLGLARAYERSGDVELALATYLQLVERAPTPRSYLTVAPLLASLGPALPEVAPARHARIALLGNATLDQLSGYLSIECHQAGLRPTIYQAGFDQVTQEILDPASGLYAAEPDVVIVALHASRLFPRLHDDPFELALEARRAEIRAGIGELRGLLDVLTERSSALVLVHNMVVPQHPALGTLDWRDELGQAELFGEINRQLAELVRTRYRAVYIVDEDKVQSQAGKATATDARQWLMARVGWSHAVQRGLARAYVRYLRALRGITRKCIVVDLDNTLWGGVVGEDGIDGLHLGADSPGNAFTAFQRELERLWRRGILLAVCSKNNREDALEVIEKHPGMVLKSEHIAAYRINWQSKVANLREIAAELNIGLDSLVFLDDNPAERALVRSELPAVLVPELPADPAEYRAALLDLDVFESLAVTSEDRQRGKMYAQQAERRKDETASSGASLGDYLAGLDIHIEIGDADSATISRIAQLTSKTNQFNVTTRRYSEADIRTMQAAGAVIQGIRVRDRFGDNGLVGVSILAPPTDGVREIDSLLLSCRVLGRGVETALLASLAKSARTSGISRLRGVFVPTPKNTPAADCFARHGFSLVEQLENGTQVWELDLAEHDLQVPSWLDVQAPGYASLAVAPG